MTEWHKRYVRDRLRAAIGERAAKHASGRLIDIGCGEKPYASLLAPSVTQHVGVDHAGSIHSSSRVDIVASAYDIPVADAAFDSALMSEVLEHLEEPLAALRECARTLRPGGVLILTAPFIWHVHEAPRDFYRYSPYGLRHLLEQAGFEVEEVAPLGGFWTTATQLLLYNLVPFERGLIRRAGILRAMGCLLMRVALAMERRWPRTEWASHHIAVARRSDGAAP
jgi:ubiquinone/menaquinone biosynthesis C-methylase UbiE